MRITSEKMSNIATESGANIAVSSIEPFANEILESVVLKLGEIENIGQINRQNNSKAIFDDYLDLGLPTGPEPDVEFIFSGMDDFEIDGPFVHEQRRLEGGNLKLSENQVIVSKALAVRNGWEIGSLLTFQIENKGLIDIEIAGLYSTIEVSGRIDDLQIYGTTELINRIQGDNLYTFVQFYVINPGDIKMTRKKIEELVWSEGFYVNVNDFLYQRMVSPMYSLRVLLKTMLTITFFVTGIIISLLLSIWMRERRKETGLLISLGINKKSIMLQRFFETGTIFLLAFSGTLISIIFSNFAIQSSLLPINETEAGEITNLYLTVMDFVWTLVLGLLISVLAITISSLPLIKTHPKKILSTID